MDKPCRNGQLLSTGSKGQSGQAIPLARGQLIDRHEWLFVLGPAIIDRLVGDFSG